MDDEVRPTSSETSWWQIEVFDETVGRMDYCNYALKIYDHALNKDVNLKNEERKFYFEPVVQLNHLSARSYFNNNSQKPEMTFQVNMWSDSVRNRVHKFLSEDLNFGPLNIKSVRVLPIYKVMIYSEDTYTSQFFL